MMNVSIHDQLTLVQRYEVLGYEAYFDWDRLVDIYDGNIEGSLPLTKGRMWHAEMSLIQRWVYDKGYFANVDISPKTGLFEWFIHNVSDNPDEILEGDAADLIEESNGHDFADPEEALYVLLNKVMEFHNTDRINLKN